MQKVIEGRSSTQVAAALQQVDAKAAVALDTKPRSGCIRLIDSCAL
jgi:hypothetical protein